MNLNRNVATGVTAAVVAMAAALIMPSEGKRNTVYRDPIGIPTVCYGHTGRDVKSGQRYTDQQCAELLQGDALTAYQDVTRCVTRPLNINEAAAFTSFAFNVGGDKFCGSGVARKAQAGDMAGACAELSKWVHAGGKVLPGLVTRREKEREMCEGKA